ncbi:hypothetical protein [Sphingomonas gilva]|uniref:hypothetical protein n=1 Tax=Sphingomonas gilva TaxID=2305907 RepID=UPI0015F80CB4|nr:hypothetical protein [Sphingomonas gilva]
MALVLALTLQAVAPTCAVLDPGDGSAGRFICTSIARKAADSQLLHGPGIACSRHFAFALRRGDRLRAERRRSGSFLNVIETSTGTIRFGDEDFWPNDGTRWRVPVDWLPGLHRHASESRGDAGLPYHLVDASGRYVLPGIDGGALTGDARDAAVLSRISTRRSDTVCDWTIDLGTIGSMDDADAPAPHGATMQR